MPDTTLTMTLAKALVYRNRLVEKIRKVQRTIQTAACYWDYEAPTIDIRVEFTRLIKLQKHLVEVKTAITVANTTKLQDGLSAQEIIFYLAELKGCIAQYNALQCEGRKQRNADGTFSEFKAQISAEERDQIVEVLTTNIDKLQDDLNVFNHKCTITVAKSLE